MKGTVFFLSSFIALTLSQAAVCEIFKWVDENGKTHFSDSRPERGTAETVHLRINTYATPEISSAADPAAGSRDRVVMYSASWCGVCKEARNYFRRMRIPFTEYDVETSAKGKREFKKLGAKGVPVILLRDKRMNGFSVDSFERLRGG